MHVGTLEKTKKSITNQLKDWVGITSIGIGKDYVFIYVLDNKTKKDVLTKLKMVDLTLIRVYVTGQIIPAED